MTRGLQSKADPTAATPADVPPSAASGSYDFEKSFPIIFVALWFGIALLPLFFLVIAGLTAVGLIARTKAMPEPVQTLALPLFILAGSLTPHLIFLTVFDMMVDSGIEPAALTGWARTYETAAVWLHERVKPMLGMSLLATLALSLAVLALSWRLRAPALMSRLQAYRKWTGRLSLVIIGVSAFTVFTAMPSASWSPDLDMRLNVQMRLAEAYKVDAVLAGQTADAVVVKPRSVALPVAHAALLAQDAYDQTRNQDALGALGLTEARRAAAEAAGAAVAEDMAAAALPVRAADIGAAGTPDDLERHASLDDVRGAASAAAKAQTLAEATKAEAKARISAALGTMADSILKSNGFEPAAEIVGTVQNKLLDVLFDKISEALLARAFADNGPVAAFRLSVRHEAGEIVARLNKRLPESGRPTEAEFTHFEKLVSEAAHQKITEKVAAKKAQDEPTAERSRPHRIGH